MEAKPAREVRLAIVLYDASALATRVYRSLRFFISVFCLYPIKLITASKSVRTAI